MMRLHVAMLPSVCIHQSLSLQLVQFTRLFQLLFRVRSLDKSLGTDSLSLERLVEFASASSFCFCFSASQIRVFSRFFLICPRSLSSAPPIPVCVIHSCTCHDSPIPTNNPSYAALLHQCMVRALCRA